ncbi:Neurofilament heavy polypeptide like [Actinidia chinensis var. chinensis]|uniref:Neurofilament heavy polypeptide like n=1 Tax=Actinidia chinensis var. chinensis TaxID=1590841 RepID=A0A2R6PRZ8_ACTCC|nr:Neurofilament heavy polypeptide like [Actinidia chinensis var. chinensis]
MEDPVKDQSSAPAKTGRSSSKLRYPLRSATKSKEEKPLAAELSNSSVPKKGRPPSSVSKSVGVLELSGKEKSAKPPRRLSIPAKSPVSTVPKSVGSITPISEASAKTPANSRGKNDTPVSGVSKSSNRRKFSVLSSASYWLSQIKLSESDAKHTISLGFFKLALEAGCEPLQRMRDELKSYARRHNLTELGEPVKQLFEGYNILENFEQMQVSETCSQVPEEGTRSSDDDVRSSSSVTGTRKLKLKSLNTTEATVQASVVTESVKKDATGKDNRGTRTRGTWNKNSANVRLASETAGSNISKKSQKPSKQESNEHNNKLKRQAEKSACELDQANPSRTDKALQANKENMDAPKMEEISLTEV